MKGDPSGYISTSALMDKSLFEAYVEHKAFLLVNEHITSVMHDMGVLDKVRCGCVVKLDDNCKGYTVYAKVMVRGGFFMHEEPWGDFPSDHFKTKIILACG